MRLWGEESRESTLGRPIRHGTEAEATGPFGFQVEEELAGRTLVPQV